MRPLRLGERLTEEEHARLLERLRRKGKEGRRRFGAIDPRRER